MLTSFAVNGEHTNVWQVDEFCQKGFGEGGNNQVLGGWGEAR